MQKLLHLNLHTFKQIIVTPELNIFAFTKNILEEQEY
jgi:hypothetical protein